MAKRPSKRAQEALSYYINEDCTLKEVSIDLNIPMGTINRWSQIYEWGKKKEEHKKRLEEELEKKLREGKIKEHLRLIEDFKTLYGKYMDKALNTDITNVQILESKDLKTLIDAISRITSDYKELLRIEGTKQKVEHSGAIEIEINTVDTPINLLGLQDEGDKDAEDKG